MSSPHPSYRPTPPPDAGEQWVDPATGLSWDRGADQWFDPATGRWTVYTEAPQPPAAWPPPQEWTPTPEWTPAPQLSGPPQHPYGQPQSPHGPPPKARSGPSGKVLALVGGGLAVVVAGVIVLALVLTSGGSTPSATGRASGSGAPSGGSSSGPMKAPLTLTNPTEENRNGWPKGVPTPFPIGEGKLINFGACTGQPQGPDDHCAQDSLEWDRPGLTEQDLQAYAQTLTSNGYEHVSDSWLTGSGVALAYGTNYQISVTVDTVNYNPGAFIVYINYFEKGDMVIE